MDKGIDFKKCKRILQEDFSNENNVEKLQKYLVNLRDAYNYCFRYEELGLTSEALKRGFIVEIESESASGYTLKDSFMSVNLPMVMKNIETRLNDIYTHSEELSKKIRLLDNIQKNENDLLIAKEVAEKEYDKEDNPITLEYLGRYISMDIANIMMDCGYSSWIFFKQDNLEKYKEQVKNVLANDRDIDDVAKEINATYDELVDRIDNATENKEPVNMFKVKDFYCEFSNVIDDKDILNIFINKDNKFIKVNDFYFNRDTEVDKIKKFIETTMCNVIGNILTDGTIEKEYFRQGYVYKNYENFYKRDGICYVSEYDGDNINDAGISFEGICEEVVDYLKEYDVDMTKITDKQIEGMAEDLFEAVDWQFVCSLVTDGWLEGYIEDLPNEFFINGKNPLKEENEVERAE